jgi:hypothetical protein
MTTNDDKSIPNKFTAITDFGSFQVKLTNRGQVINIGTSIYCVQITHDHTENKASLSWLGTDKGGCEETGKAIHGKDTIGMVDLGFTILRQLYPDVNSQVELRDSSKFNCTLPNGTKESISNIIYNLLITGKTYYQRSFGANLKYPGAQSTYDNFVRLRNSPDYFDNEYDFKNDDLNEILRPLAKASNTWADFFEKLYKKYGRASCMYMYPWLYNVYGYLTQMGAIHVDWNINLDERPIIEYNITKQNNNVKNTTRKTYEYNPNVWIGGVRNMSYSKYKTRYSKTRKVV